jgi:uncharacterized cupredoxin-like copper-binding protein
MARHSHGRRRLVNIVGIAALTVTAAACGDDTDTNAVVTSGNATAAAGDTAEPGTTAGAITAGMEDFCAKARELDEQDSLPTMAQVEAYADAAPSELDEPLDVIMTRLEESDGNFTALFGDPDALAAFDELDAFEVEHCGKAPDEGPEQDPSVTVLDPDATRVDLEARDFEFEGDYPSASGRYSFVMTNEGEEVHLMILVHMEEDADIDEMLESQGEAGVIEVFESDVAAPGDEAVLTADLVAGRWVMLCPIPSQDGESHYKKGMIDEFTIS